MWDSPMTGPQLQFTGSHAPRHQRYLTSLKRGADSILLVQVVICPIKWCNLDNYANQVNTCWDYYSLSCCDVGETPRNGQGDSLTYFVGLLCQHLNGTCKPFEFGCFSYQVGYTSHDIPNVSQNWQKYHDQWSMISDWWKRHSQPDFLKAGIACW